MNEFAAVTTHGLACVIAEMVALAATTFAGNGVSTLAVTELPEPKAVICAMP